jgi:hypothetical protein
MVATAWTCVRCQQHNLPGRTVCELCHLPRDNPSDVDEGVSVPPPASHGRRWIWVFLLRIATISLVFCLPFWMLLQIPIRDSSTGTLVGLSYLLWIVAGKPGKWLILTGMGWVLFARHLPKTEVKPTLLGYALLCGAGTALEVFCHLGGLFGVGLGGSAGALIAIEVLFPVGVGMVTLWGAHRLLGQAPQDKEPG